MYPITSLTASVLALIFVALSIKVVKFRHKYKTSLGVAGHNELERATRAHGNFAEYTPIFLLLMLCAEANKANFFILAILGLLFILGRLLHAYAFIVNKHHFKHRVRAMVLTFTVIIGLSVWNIVLVALGSSSFNLVFNFIP